MERAVRIGIAGLGRLGRRHAENFAWRVRGAEVIAAMSPDPGEGEWARRTLGVRHGVKDYGELVALADLDAVVIVSPTTFHPDQVIAALEAGKHVFCEKPLALVTADCLRVEAVAAKHPSLQVLIGFVRRFDIGYRTALEKIRAGVIGTPFLYRSQAMDKYDPSGFFVKYAPLSGGIFLDMGIHDIDMARALLGGPKARRVYAAGTRVVHPDLAACGDVDNGVATIEFAEGQLAIIQLSRTLAYGLEVTTEVLGSSGRLTVGAGIKAGLVDIADATGQRYEGLPTFWERFEEAFRVEAQAFVDAVRGTGKLPLKLNDATEATRIGVAITEAFRTGRVVELN